MSRYNTTIDNVSPLIQYQPVGDWREGSASDDPSFDRYSDATFTLCTANGASATFTFNGTDIWIFGAKRDNHGPYTVTLDGSVIEQAGFAVLPGVFQTPLFVSAGLQNKQHTVVITNTQTDDTKKFLDIDFIIWESEAGSTDQPSSNQIFDVKTEDTHSAFTYQPEGAWSTNGPSFVTFSNSSGHSTSSSGASVTYTFTGDKVSIFGTVGPNNGPYGIQLDGGIVNVYNATKQALTSQILLYQADSLESGIHTVKLINQPAISGQTLDIDFAVVSLASNDAFNTKVSKPLAGGVIAGIILGILVVLTLTACGFLLVRRQRAQVNRHSLQIADHFMAPVAMRSNSPLEYHGPLEHLRAPTPTKHQMSRRYYPSLAETQMSEEHGVESEIGYPAAHKTDPWNVER